MLNIQVAVEASDEMLEELVVDPSGDYRLKMVQRDATYRGMANDDRVINFVYKVIKS